MRYLQMPIVIAGAIAVMLVPGQVLFAVPAAAAPTREEPAPSAAQARRQMPKVNRRVPKVRPVPLVPQFSETPTDRELFRARVFEEPLVPIGAATSPAENRALAEAVTAFVSSGRPGDLGPFEAYLREHADSPWRASLLLNLGLAYRKAGRFSRAVRSWQWSWDLAKDETAPFADAVADRALGELTLLKIEFAQLGEVERLFSEASGRRMRGVAAEKAGIARAALWSHRHDPDLVFPSATTALRRILVRTDPQYRGDRQLSGFRAPYTGVTLTQTAALAQEAGLKLQMAYWTDRRTEIPVPAVVHLDLGHYSAIVKADRTKGLYLIDDPLVGGANWMSAAVLAEETSGYFLIPKGSVPEGWRRASREDGDNVVGRCFIPGDPGRTRKRECQQGGTAGAGSCCRAMPGYSFHTMLASLHIVDTPVGYSAPRGPSVDFTVIYNQREATQPSIFTYSNLGPRWNFDFLSFVEDDASNPWANVTLHTRGGGSEEHGQFDGQWYLPPYEPTGRLARTSLSPVRYELHYPDGSVDVYAQPDGAFSAGRRVFLTEVIDPQGQRLRLSYDEDLRLVALTDAIGQVTVLSYELSSDPFKITGVTDPFGRSASFEYDETGGLARITDVIGLSTAFEYGTNVVLRSSDYFEDVHTEDFVVGMTTPYGKTTFRTGYHDFMQHIEFVEAVDPLGGVERMERFTRVLDGFPGPAEVAPKEPEDGGYDFAEMNRDLGVRNTFYWDKRATALFPGVREKAVTTHWLTDPDRGIAYGMAVAIKHSEKRPLENRVWYSYDGYQLYGTPPTRGPSRVGRVLDDGTSQIRKYEYNAIGKVIKVIEPPMNAEGPERRETIYVYGTGSEPDADQVNGTGVDLLEVRQRKSAAPNDYDVVAHYTYANHQLLTATDAAGQTTESTYEDGLLKTIVTPERNGPGGVPLTAPERTTTYAYYPDSYGRLWTVTGPEGRDENGSPVHAVTTYEYDGLGRLSKVSNSEGYSVVTGYDALDRPTKVVYPDGTYEETTYDRLDADGHRDRLGRWTHTVYDALRRPVATRDPAGRTTQKNEWVSAGCSSGCGGGGAKLSKLIDANGNETTWEYDVQGRVVKEIRASQKEYAYTYENTTSRLKSVQDPNGNVKTYTYNLDDSLKGISYAEGAGIAETPDVGFEYDPWYNRATAVTTTRQGVNETTTYTYVPPGTLGAGTLQSVDGPLEPPNDDKITYGYDELGRVASRQIGSSANTQTQAFDSLGRLTKLTNLLGNFDYTYEGVTGRPASVKYPNDQVTTYAYLDNVGDHRLQEIHNKKKPGGATLSKFNYTYDAVGNITSWRQQNEANPAQVYEFGYDPADQLTAAILKSADPTPVLLKRYYYAYDPAGNRTAEQIDDSVRGWTYNNMNQLVAEQTGGALVFKGTVNEPAIVTVGGRQAAVTPTGVGGEQDFQGAAAVPPEGRVAISAKDGAGNVSTNTYQVNQASSSKSFTFDSNGNMTSDGSKTYVWDAENRLVEVKQGTNTLASFTYNKDGIRTSKTAGGVTTTYVLEGSSVVEERVTGGGGPTRHFQGPGIDSVLASQDGSGTATYYVSDHLGSIRQKTNASGQPTLTREYDPWGNQLEGGSVAGWAFTGREWDPEIGLHYYRARYYAPTAGRFISTDPLGMSDGLNRYPYAHNTPVSLVDPLGTATAPPGGPIGDRYPVEKERMFEGCRSLGPRFVPITYEEWRLPPQPTWRMTNEEWREWGLKEQWKWQKAFMEQCGHSSTDCAEHRAWCWLSAGGTYCVCCSRRKLS